MLGSDFIGLWDRVGLTVAGAAIAGAGRSLWFQGPSRFIDVRGAGGGLRSEAFGGVTEWDPAGRILTWRHELDLHPGPSDDSGRIEWSDGDLLEHGSADTPFGRVDYTERWRPVTIGAGPGHQLIIADLACGIGRLALGGGHAAVMIDERPDGGVRAGHLTDRGWAWVFDLVLGQPLGLEPRAPACARGDEFEWFGRTWHVVERAEPTGP